MNETIIEYSVGDVVEYRTIMQHLRRVRVTERGDEDGVPVFDGELLNLDGEPTGETVWGYDSDIVAVERAS